MCKTIAPTFPEINPVRWLITPFLRIPGLLQIQFLIIYLCYKLRLNNFFKSVKPIPAGIYLFKVNNRNTKTMCEIC